MQRARVLIRRFCALLALFFVIHAAPGAHAALGDDVTAVAADQARLQATLQVRQNSHFTIHELSAPTGVKVREFANHNGKIFAVSWSGGWRPNLRDIMGAHYEQLIAATRGRRIARGPVRIDLPGMVLVMGGPQRAHFGRVYLTDLLPADVAPEAIQ